MATEKPTITIKGEEYTYMELTFENIMDWAEEHDKLDWLENALTNGFEIKRLANKNHPEMIVKVEKPSYLDVRRHWAETFAPALIATAKPKEPSMLDKLKARKAK